MAIKKTAGKSTGTELQPWEAKLAAKAVEAQQTAASTGGSTKSIGTRGGVFTIDGAEVDGKEMELIVLDFIVDVTYYSESFDSDEIVPPTAFCLSRYEKPPSGSGLPEPVWADGSHPDFAGREINSTDEFQWGSADKGRGKAAKSRRRLIVVPEGWLEDHDHPDNAPRKLMVPVTSGTSWDKYVKDLKPHNRPPCGVLTKVTISPDPKYQFKLGFKMMGLIENDSMGDVLDLVDNIQDDLFRPYANYDQEPEEKPAKGSGKALAKGAAARKPARR
jgi:hypothetical protein